MKIEDKRRNRYVLVRYGPPGAITLRRLGPYYVGSYRILYTDPKWKDKVSKGVNATLPYTNRKGSFVYRNGLHTSVSKVTGVVSTSTYCGVDPNYYAAVDVSRLDEAKALASVYTLKNVNKVRQGHAGMVSLGELRETIGMIRHPARGLRAAFGKFDDDTRKLYNVTMRKHGVKYMEKNWGRIVNDIWLEWSLGVRPFVNEITQIASSALDIRFERVVQAKGIATLGKSQEFKVSKSDGIGSNITYTNRILDRNTARYVVGVKETVTSDMSPCRRIVELGGFTWSNVPATAYELIPLSFVFDYFVNLGDLLETGFTSLNGVCYYSLTVVNTRYTDITNFRATPVTDVKNTIYLYNKEPYYEGVYNEIVRTQELPSLSIDSIRFNLPTYGSQFLNMAAILSNKRKWNKRQGIEGTFQPSD